MGDILDIDDCRSVDSIRERIDKLRIMQKYNFVQTRQITAALHELEQRLDDLGHAD